MFGGKTFRLRLWRHDELGGVPSLSIDATAVVGRRVDGQKAKPLFVAIARWSHLSQASKEGLVVAVTWGTPEASTRPDCPCSRSGPDALCSCGCLCQNAWTIVELLEFTIAETFRHI